jgi:hypothetical protein
MLFLRGLAAGTWGWQLISASIEVKNALSFSQPLTCHGVVLIDYWTEDMGKNLRNN